MTKFLDTCLLMSKTNKNKTLFAHKLISMVALNHFNKHFFQTKIISRIKKITSGHNCDIIVVLQYSDKRETKYKL